MSVSHDAGSSVGFDASSNPSWTHTPVGTPTAVFVFVSWTGYPTNPNTVSGVTYGGQAMTAVPGSQANNDFFQGTNNRGSVQAFYLNNPPSGPQTVSVTFSSGSYGRAGATTVTGAVATTPYGTPATASGLSTSPSATVGSSTAGNLVLGAFVSDYSTSSILANRTQSWSGTSGPALYGGGVEYAAGGGSQAMDWNVNSTSNRWAATAFEVIGNPAPTNSVAPAVTGTAQVGQTLTTTNGTWTNSPDSYSYLWKHGDDSAAGGTATNSTYVPVAGDVGFGMKCIVTATNIGGSGTATSNTTSNVIVAAPTNSVAPSCAPSSGTVADTFTFSPGTWTGSPTSYETSVSVDGGAYSVIDTSAGGTPAKTGAQLGGPGTIATRVRAQNAGGWSDYVAGTTLTVTSGGSVAYSINGRPFKTKRINGRPS